MRRVCAVAIAVGTVAVVHGGSDGPAYHLTLPAGYQVALRELRLRGARDGSVTSYNWPAVLYSWPERFDGAPFAFVGIQTTDKWVALDPSLDRATIELRLRLSGDLRHPDSLWKIQSDAYRGFSDSLFSVPSNFNASDYFFCENLPIGVHVLEKWRADAKRSGTNYLTIYEIDPEKLREFLQSL